MGTETISDFGQRKNWEKFISLAHQRLRENQIPLDFSTFKNDGSYSKARSGTPAVYFAFAKDSNRTWVELELKSRTSKGESYAQTELYSFLQKNCRTENYPNLRPITWNEDDIQSSPRSQDGFVIRIKIYLKSSDNDLWINAMIQLAKAFLPLLRQYR